jgi:hypothetical protein
MEAAHRDPLPTLLPACVSSCAVARHKVFMNAHRWIFVGVCLSGIAMTIAPASASCPVPLTLEEYFAHTPTIFVGRAVAQRIVPRPGRPAGTRATETTFDVEELWNGQPTATLRILNCGWGDGDQTMTCSSDFIFVVGSRYVVFAAGDPPETSACSPTALVEGARETLQWLAGRPHKKAH